ncbi:MAG: VWA domain-containing protein [Cytophagales bacterium]|jgi:Ca-activated chloride channel family protein|nr:VWA domain-containing protein [Cytophagales bacterium]MCA6366480.1 VWA domain-containing protein [Cytophagales bacterium]MCA6372604.1 VWA domain-containing protein [Cytophagales bacterium]MCA6376820.1 VWA domain-containing protein [Cytophagales bacterium]MCA6383822.1 VWA domain-containing protein [Cytophagales bacterium]
MDSFLDPWYSLEWFTTSVLKGFTWENQLFLYGLLAIPFLFILRWLSRYYLNQKLPVALVKSDLKSSPLNLIRFFPELVLSIVIALLLIALARPQRTNEKVEQWTEGIDIMIALDISQSMQIEDFKPNRLEAAKDVARDFIKGRKQDRIGLVVFSGDAFSLAPLTTDYDLLKNYLNDISFEMIESRGTAIGSALAVVTNRMRESESKSKVCILISDGDNTAGNIDPITSAELAGAYNIKLYTIVVGQEGMVPFGKDFFGRPQMVENTVDESTMRKIAEIGGGEFFRVTDNEALKNVFKRIDQYEKAEIKESRFKDTSDFYFIYLKWAIAFFLLWLLLKSSFLSNVLQD